MKPQRYAEIRNRKLLLEDHVEDIFSAILNNKNISPLSSLLIILNIGNPFKIIDKGLIFNPDKDEVFVELSDSSAKDFIINFILDKYTPSDIDFLKKYIRHNFTRHLSDKRKSNLGKYYTPEHLVRLIFELANPHIRKESYILDIAAGCGAFLEYAEGNRIMGGDIDSDAVEVLKLLNIKNVICDNSLLSVNRKKYHLSKADHIVAVGNPPYNDITSKNKKYGHIAKEKLNLLMDKDVISNDLGISFLKALNKLSANIICVLHPLSYLIKKANFNKLGEFKFNYILKDAVIFSSREFSDTQNTPFPIIAGLYLRGTGMEYEYIKNFQFNILNSEKKLMLRNIETIDNYIRKYPPKKKKDPISDIGLYMYNIRDLNSLLTTGNLTEKENFNNHITINFKELYKYAYLNCMRRYFKKDFLFGNLSPIVNRNSLENDEFLQDAFIIDTIFHNQRLLAFNVHNKKSIIYTESMIDNYMKREHRFVNTKPNLYKIIINFIYGQNYDLEPLKLFIKQYFEKLKNKMLP